MTGFEVFCVMHGTVLTWVAFIGFIFLLVSYIVMITNEWTSERTDNIVGGFAALFLVVFVVFGVFQSDTKCDLMKNAKTEWTSNYEMKIYSINDRFSVSSNTSVSFFLGSGSISGSSNEIHRYYYLSKGEFGGYEVGKVNSSICEVVEYDGSPKLIVYKKVIADEFLLENIERGRGFAGDVYDDVESERKYVFYIPKHSITSLDYKIDLEN